MNDPLHDRTVYQHPMTTPPADKIPTRATPQRENKLIIAVVATASLLLVLMTIIGVTVVSRINTTSDSNAAASGSSSNSVPAKPTAVPQTKVAAPAETTSTLEENITVIGSAVPISTTSTTRMTTTTLVERLSSERATDRFDEYLEAGSGSDPTRFLDQFRYPIRQYYGETDVLRSDVAERFEQQLIDNTSVFFSRSSAVMVTYRTDAPLADLSADFDFEWYRADDTIKTGTNRLTITVSLVDRYSLPIVAIHE